MGELIQMKADTAAEAAERFMTRVRDELEAREALVIVRDAQDGVVVRHYGDDLALLGLLEVTRGLVLADWMEEDEEEEGDA